MGDSGTIKIEIYDFFALFLPGLIVACEAWGSVVGWSELWTSLQNLNISTGSILFLGAFAVGHLVQEFGDMAIRKICGVRFFEQGRDQALEGPLGTLIRERIQQESHQPESSLDADSCFHYCFTRVNGRFIKRDFFLTTTDLCKGLFTAAILALPLLGIWVVQAPSTHSWPAIQILVFVLISAWLAWRRMRRFRLLSEVPLFHIFLAVSAEGTNKSS